MPLLLTTPHPSPIIEPISVGKSACGLSLVTLGGRRKPMVVLACTGRTHAISIFSSKFIAPSVAEIKRHFGMKPIRCNSSDRLKGSCRLIYSRLLTFILSKVCFFMFLQFIVPKASHLLFKLLPLSMLAPLHSVGFVIQRKMFASPARCVSQAAAGCSSSFRSSPVDLIHHCLLYLIKCWFLFSSLNLSIAKLACACVTSK